MARQRARATSGEASRAIHSISEAVIARSRWRKRCGPRSRMAASDSLSAPPAATTGFVTFATNGTALRNCVTVPRGTLPTQPATGYIGGDDPAACRRDHALRTVAETNQSGGTLQHKDTVSRLRIVEMWTFAPPHPRSRDLFA